MIENEIRESTDSMEIITNDIQDFKNYVSNNNIMNNDIDNISFGKYVEKFFSGTKFDANNTLKWFMKPENSLTSQEYDIIIKYLNSPNLTNTERIEFIIRLRDNLYKLKTNENETGDSRIILFRTALNNAIYNRNFSDILSEAIINPDEKILTSILFKYIDEGKDIFGDISIKDESGNPIVILDDNLRQALSEKDYVIKLNDLPEGLRNSILTVIRERLNEKIKKLTKKYIDEDKETPDYIANNLSSHEELHATLEQYSNIQKFLKTPTSLLGNQNLTKRYRAILSRFGYKVSNVDEDLLRKQEEEEKRLHEANKKRIDQWKKRNQEINGRFLQNNKNFSTSTNSLSNDINVAQQNNEGIQALKDSNIEASQLNYGTNDIELTENDELYLKSEAFNSTCNELLPKQGIITIGIMTKLYDMKEMNVNYTEWEKLKLNLKTRGISEDDIKQSELLLTQFDNKIKSTLENSYIKYYEDKETVNNSTKLSAAGDVINSITYIFNSLGDRLKYGSLCEGFKYIDTNPIKIEGENMLIYGTLNGTEINIKYNMKSGELFMNSFLKENHMPNMYIIGDKDADYPLPKIDNFAEILNKHGNLDNLYEDTKFSEETFVNIPRGPRPPSSELGDIQNNRPNNKSHMQQLKQKLDKEPPHHKPRPPIRPNNDILPGRIPLPGLIGINGEITENNKVQFEKVLGNTLDVIGERVKKHIDEYSTLNTASDKLFNTIVPNYRNVIFVQEGSNIFTTLQILKNADEPDLQYFNNEFMPKIMEYLGMKWGESTMFPNQNKMRTNTENNPNSPRGNFIKKTEKFINDSQKLGTRLNYDSNYNHCLSEIIKDVIKNDIKITKQNMKKYIDELESNRYITVDEELDTKLSEI